jgi:hypothetical protein
MVSRPVRPELKNRFLLLSGICGFVDVSQPLWWEDAYAVYSCCWSSPVQLFSGRELSGETEVIGEIPLHYDFVRHKSNITWDWSRGAVGLI